MSDADPRIAPAVAGAEALLRSSLEQTTWRERRRAERLGRLLGDAHGRALLFALTDEVLRTPEDDRAMAQLRALVVAGLPSALPWADRLAMRAAALGSRFAPRQLALTS